jgi:hypothetical protein
MEEPTLGPLGRGSRVAPDEDELQEIDSLAEVICKDGLPEVQSRYIDHGMPPTITSFTERIPTSVDLGALVSRGIRSQR